MYWPNPVAKGEKVTFATAITNGSYSVINMMGLEVAIGAFSKGKGTISTQALAAGVYTVVIQASQTRAQHGWWWWNKIKNN